MQVNEQRPVQAPLCGKCGVYTEVKRVKHDTRRNLIVVSAYCKQHKEERELTHPMKDVENGRIFNVVDVMFI